MRRCVCPGSFDPVTAGHLDVIERAARLYDEVSVVVMGQSTKAGLFSVEERVGLLAASTAGLERVRVDSWGGLLVDYCRDRDVPVVVKGLRAVTDFDYEIQMAQMNHRLSGVETVFVATNPAYSFLSSSLVKQVALGGGDVAGLVPPAVQAALTARARR